jgi:hypothetical protein
MPEYHDEIITDDQDNPDLSPKEQEEVKLTFAEIGESLKIFNTKVQEIVDDVIKPAYRSFDNSFQDVAVTLPNIAQSIATFNANLSDLASGIIEKIRMIREDYKEYVETVDEITKGNQLGPVFNLFKDKKPLLVSDFAMLTVFSMPYGLSGTERKHKTRNRQRKSPVV